MSITDRRSPNRDPEPSLADAVSVSRFWRLVSKGNPEQCWTWLGDTDKNGYGVFVFQGRKAGAHELALSFTTGERRLPDLDTCHSCDNPPCCNPAHLRFDTRLSNVRDMQERGRAWNGSAAPKLANADVVLMRRRRAAGARQQDLAAQFGVSISQVSMLVRGLRRPEAGGPISNPITTHRKAV